MTGDKAGPIVILSPANSSRQINGTAMQSGIWTAESEVQVSDWQIEYRSGNVLCNTRRLSKIVCQDGHRGSAGSCEKEANKCSKLTVAQLAGTGSVQSRLAAQVRKTGTNPTIILSPDNTTQEIALETSKQGEFAGEGSVKIGRWKLAYYSGDKKCLE